MREAGRIQNVAVVIATGVNNDGHREVLGFDVITTEDGAGWLAFLRGLIARGLSGTALVISDAHGGLVDAVRSTLGATWQRCRTHFMRNLLTRVPKSAQALVATLVRTIFAQPDAEQTWAQRELGSFFRQDQPLCGGSGHDLRREAASSQHPLRMGRVPELAEPHGSDQPQRFRRRTQAERGLAGACGRTPPAKGVGEPCAREPHARFDGGELEKE